MAREKIQKLLQTINRISFRGLESLALVLLTNKSRCYTLLREKPFTKLHNNYAVFKEFCDNHNYVAKKHPIIGWVTDNEEDILATQMLLDEVSKNITCKKSFNWAIAEIVCKVLAYRELKERDTFVLPYYFSDSKECTTYEVSRIFDLWKSMRAFGLKAKEKGYPSILLFRGTDFSMLSTSSRFSIMSNFDPSGPGHTIYNHAREEISHWLKGEASGGTLPIVWGYSLGGSLASFALLNDPLLFSQEHTSYIFNHPGFSEENLKKWESIPKKEQPKALAFVTDGDLVSKFGLLFGHTLGIKLAKTMPPIRAHTDLQLIQTNVKIKPIDLIRENASTSRRIYSKLHKRTGRLFFNIGLKLFFP